MNIHRFFSVLLLAVALSVFCVLPVAGASLSDEDAAYKAQNNIDGWRFTRIYNLTADCNSVLLPILKTGSVKLELYFAYNGVDMPHAYIISHSACLSQIQQTEHTIEKIPLYLDKSILVTMHIDSKVEVTWITFACQKHDLSVKCTKNGDVTYKIEQK